MSADSTDLALLVALIAFGAYHLGRMHEIHRRLKRLGGRRRRASQ